jgi:hypothetical protein
MWPFKRKQTEYQPVNRIENLLKEAANNAGARGEFMRTLFHFPLFALAKAIEQRVSFETKLVDGEPAIFVFTSLQALQYSIGKSGRSQTPYIEFKPLDLFGIAAANSFNMILNSGHDYGRYFKHEELKSLMESEPEGLINVEKNTSVSLGQPAKGYPEQLLPALVDLISRNAEVKNIYLGWLVSPEIQELGSSGEYLAAIEFRTCGSSARERVFKDLQIIAKDLISDRSMVLAEANKGWIESGALMPVIPLQTNLPDGDHG